MSDTAGRAYALTLITPLRSGGRCWARILFGAARHLPPITEPLRTMSFIHFARWSIVDRLPGDTKRLPVPVLFFESNFDVPLARYVDAFAYVLTRRMKAVWWRAFGYPGLLPTNGFTRWVEHNSIEAGHYYSAYPEATTTMVRAGLAVHERLGTFESANRHRDQSDEDFADAYHRLLTDVQAHL